MNYRHYKGGKYQFIAEVVHSETLERMIAYKSLGDGICWVRPKEMFYGKVIYKGEWVRRFLPVE